MRNFSKDFGRKNLAAFLQDVVPVLILDQIKGVGVDLGEKILLELGVAVDILYGFLYDPTAITVLRKVDELALDCVVEFFLLFLSSSLKYFLKDIVAESILH